MSADVLLSRLEFVRQTSAGRWRARCPAHPDRTPSLCIREVDDGRVLLHDFGGCETKSVLSAVGLRMSDLFGKGGWNRTHAHYGLTARDRLEILHHEITVAALILADVLKNKSVDEEQWTRLAQAAARIARVCEYGRA